METKKAEKEHDFVVSFARRMAEKTLRYNGSSKNWDALSKEERSDAILDTDAMRRTLAKQILVAFCGSDRELPSNNRDLANDAVLLAEALMARLLVSVSVEPIP